MTGAGDWQSAFRELFESPNTDNWDRAFELKKPKLPERVFKYRALTPGDTRTNSLDALRHNYVWASQAKYLNDPFDCTMSFELSSYFLEGQKAKVREGVFSALPPNAKASLLRASTLAEFVGVVAEHVPTDQLPDDQRAKFVEVFIASCMREQDDLRQAWRDVYQVLTKVCSFSTSGRSPAMWTYYGDHRGYCVEYDVARMNPNQQHMLSPVHYSDERFDMSRWIALPREEMLKHTGLTVLLALHKAEHWRHEQEWRFVFPDSPKTTGMKLYMPAPNAIYLGAKISDDDRVEVTAIAGDLGVPVFEMRESETSYEMVPQ